LITNKEIIISTPGIERDEITLPISLPIKSNKSVLFDKFEKMINDIPINKRIFSERVNVMRLIMGFINLRVAVTVTMIPKTT
jgi:hypothetical protein